LSTNTTDTVQYVYHCTESSMDNRSNVNFHMHRTITGSDLQKYTQKTLLSTTFPPSAPVPGPMPYRSRNEGMLQVIDTSQRPTEQDSLYMLNILKIH